jgi:protein-tyrosine phosphatase
MLMNHKFLKSLLVMAGTSLALPGAAVHADIAVATGLQQTTGVLTDYRRLLPLEGGSNFRDMGGYRTTDGRSVRRGLLFRSAVMTSLTGADQDYLSQLGIESVMDLRSREELELFPNHWVAAAGIDYYKHDYSINDLLAGRVAEDVQTGDTASLYRGMPYLLKPQLTQYFSLLVAGKAPLVVNCSAGQDRTGIASALLLSALGVPREVVIEDYLLSTDFRRPVVERGSVDLLAHVDTNAFAALMTRYSQAEATHARPLQTADGAPYIQFAFAQIEQDYGSIEKFLEMELGVDARDLAKLQSLYLQ